MHLNKKLFVQKSISLEICDTDFVTCIFDLLLPRLKDISFDIFKISLKFTQIIKYYNALNSNSWKLVIEFRRDKLRITTYHKVLPMKTKKRRNISFLMNSITKFDSIVVENLTDTLFSQTQPGH